MSRALMHNELYKLQAEICKALAHPVRQQILDLLSSREMTGSELLEHLKIPKANLSQHLGILHNAGVVSSRREGLFQYSCIAMPQVKEACALVKSVLVERLKKDESQARALNKLMRHR